MKQKVAILGAGLVGSLLSIFLARKGYKVDLFEKRLAPENDKSQGRSINLAVSERAWNALRKVGLEEKIKTLGIPMYGRLIHHSDEQTDFQAYSKDKDAIYSTSRKTLNDTLVEEALTYDQIDFHFEHECKSIDGNQLIFTNETQHRADIIIGADGIHSVVRQTLESQFGAKFNLEELTHKYIELHISPTEQGWALEPNALHIWPRQSFMLIALPNPDKSFTCTLTLPVVGANSFATLDTEESFMKFLHENFPDALPLFDSPEKIVKNLRPSPLGTLRGYPWSHDNIALIGDAAHAIVPFFGQGMNAGFEDCVTLIQVLEETGEFDFARYQSLRKKETDAIAELSLDNFVEMRDKVGNEEFLQKKELDRWLHDNFPEIWIPMYNQVSFSTTPYSEAQQTGVRQSRILEKIIASQEWKENWPTNFSPDSVKALLANLK